MNTLKCGPNSQFTDITSTISKTYIDHENPDSRVVTASENYIVSPVRDRATSFYAFLRPLQLSGKAVWFSRQAVGRQKQAGVVQGICQKEGFSGKRTNQSLRVTAAARILMKHCRTILIAVRKCKRPKDSLHKEVSSIVLGQNNSVDNIY